MSVFKIVSTLFVASLAMTGASAAATNFQHKVSSHRWTNVSGTPGGYKEWLAGSQRSLYELWVNEKSDEPIEITFDINNLTSGSPTKQSDKSLTLGTGPTGFKFATVGQDHYITAVQVCVNNDKIKGLRIWGKMLGPNGLPKNEVSAEFTRPNCLGKWKTKVQCGAEKVGTGLRAHYKYSFKGFSGLALRCSKVESL